MPQARGLTYTSLLKECGIVLPPRKNKESGWAVEQIVKYLNEKDRNICAHLSYHSDFINALRSKPTIVVQLIRDPRDTIVAHYHTIANDSRPSNYFDFYFEDGLRLSQKEDPLLEAIKLAPYWWKGWLPWIENDIPDLILRFEDLVGPDKRYFIEQLAEKIGPEFSVEEALARIDPKTSMTFRKGLVGEWKNEFRPHHLELFNSTMGQVMETLGYDT